MDYLRQGIHLRGYAQKQPKQEYKKEAFELFSEMLEDVKREVIRLLSRVRIRSEEEVAAMEQQERAQAEARLQASQFESRTPAATVPTRKPRRCRPADRRRSHGADHPRRAEGGPQRSVPVRQRQEVQALPRPAELTGGNVLQG
jgi:preprotein translocase subunit SecA